MTKYAVYWDNGAEACGTFKDRFDTEQEAEDFGNDWLANMRSIDPEADVDNDDGGYSFDVIEVEDGELDPEAAPDSPRPEWA